MNAATPGQAAPVADVNALARQIQEAWDKAFSRPSDTALDYRMARLAVETALAAQEYEPGSVDLPSGERDVEEIEVRPAPELAAELDAIEKVVQSHERVMYAAAIDIRHGQPGAARRLLGEELGGWNGPEWDGTETGAQYLKRTRGDS